MEIIVTVDPSKHLRGLAEDQKQIPFALSRAVNKTALDVQRAARVQNRRIFTLRRPEWADRSVKVVKFASKKDPRATVGIHPPGASGEARADILAKFEDQTQKLPRGRTIAIPVSSRIKRGNTGVISKRDRPKAYNFRQQGKRIVGDRGTFIVRKPDGSGTIFQRVGKKPGTIYALYILARRARIKPDLQFITRSVGQIDKNFVGHMVREFDNAVRTAK